MQFTEKDTDEEEIKQPLIQAVSKQQSYAAKWSTLFLICCLLLVVNSSFSMLAPIFPEEAAKKKVSPGVVGLIFSIYSFTTFLCSPVFGMLLSKGIVGRPTLLLVGTILVAVSNAAFGLVDRIDNGVVFIIICLVIRVLLGVGSSGVDTSAVAMAAALFSGTDIMGLALGMAEMVVNVAWAIGPMIGAWLFSVGGFGVPFYVGGVVTILLGPIPVLILPKRISDSLKDASGEANKGGILSFLSNTMVLLLCTCGVFGAAALTFLEPLLAPHMQAHGFTHDMIGYAFAVIGLLDAAFAPCAGFLSDAIGHRQVMTIGLVFCGISYLFIGPSPIFKNLTTLLSFSGFAIMLYIALGVIGSTSAMSLVPMLPALIGTQKEADENIAAGLATSVFYLGGAVGPLVGGWLVTALQFPWTATIFGFGLLICGVALGTILLIQKHKVEIPLSTCYGVAIDPEEQKIWVHSSREPQLQSMGSARLYSVLTSRKRGTLQSFSRNDTIKQQSF